jgi:hypothetical protein
MVDRQIPPYHLSPEAWELGQRNHQLAVELHEMGCDDDGYDQRLDERASHFDRLSEFSAEELRAFIDGMHASMAEHFW